MAKSSRNIRWVFFGTPDFVIPALEALEKHGFAPALIVSAPDKPRGRKHELSPTPVKAWGVERGIDVVTPTTLKDEMFVAELANTDWDFFLVAAYAKFLPKALLDMPKHGSLNIHPSLLPKYRGPSPFLSAILADDRQTGVSIMQMGEVMDAGPIVAQARVEIDEADWPLTGSVLSELLFTEGGNLLAEVLEPWIKGEITPELQDESKATFTKKFTDSDALVDISRQGLDEKLAREALLKIRAFDKNPRAHFFVNNKRIIITEAEIVEGKLELLKVIPEGKKEVLYKG
ncbi:MAG: methionyl-tRNA formyltransferase [bacterium]|nr:methionyl-tRNA formyltransferase [bacterium]